MEPDLDKFLKAFEQNHVRRDPRLEGVVKRFKEMSQDDLTYSISSLYKNTTSDEYKLSWRDAAMSVYLARLTDQLLAGMSNLEKSNQRLANKTNELILAVGDEGGHLTVVVGVVGTLLAAALAWSASDSSWARPTAAFVAVACVIILVVDGVVRWRKRARHP